MSPKEDEGNATSNSITLVMAHRGSWDRSRNPEMISRLHLGRGLLLSPLTLAKATSVFGHTRDLPLGRSQGAREMLSFLPIIRPTSTAPSPEYAIETGKEYTREVRPEAMEHSWG